MRLRKSKKYTYYKYSHKPMEGFSLYRRTNTFSLYRRTNTCRFAYIPIHTNLPPIHTIQLVWLSSCVRSADRRLLKPLTKEEAEALLPNHKHLIK